MSYSKSVLGERCFVFYFNSLSSNKKLKLIHHLKSCADFKNQLHLQTIIFIL